MKEKTNIQKGVILTSSLVAIIFLVVVITGIVYGFLEYKKISGAITEAGWLTKEGRYNEAIEKLEFAQKRWITKNLAIKNQEIIQKKEENTQLLKDQRSYSEGTEKIKEKDWSKAKELLLTVSEKSPHYLDAKKRIEVLGEILDCKYIKGEYKMRVYDSQGRVTGIVNGEIKEEIPGSIYDKETNTVIVFQPSDSYTYEFFAVKGGNYQFTLASVLGGEVTNFYLQNIPILPGATHRIQVDEEVRKGKKGAILLIDADSDGEFEEKIPFGKELTCEDFIARTKMPEIEFPETTN